LTETEKVPQGVVSSEVRDPSSLMLNLGGDGIEIFVGELGAKILDAVQTKCKEKNCPITMKELMDQLEISMSEDLPSRTAVLNKVIELGKLNVLRVEEVTGHGGKKLQMAPVTTIKELFEAMVKETMEILNDELGFMHSAFCFKEGVS